MNIPTRPSLRQAIALLAAVSLGAGAATVQVADFAELQSAVAGASDGDEIVLAAGTYAMTASLTFSVANVTMRGATGDRDDVVLDAGLGNRRLAIINAMGVTLRDFTFARGMASTVDGIAVRIAKTGATLTNIRVTGCLVTSGNVNIGGAFLYGDKAITCEWPVRFGWEEKSGAGVHAYFPEAKQKELRKQYMHPYWKQAGEIAMKVGGHGGMDFLMDLRWAYCLQNGIPLDTNVYDLAASCCIGELSERSVRNRSSSVDFPDFTKGAWKTQPPLGIETVDLSKMGLGLGDVKKDKAALNV